MNKGISKEMEIREVMKWQLLIAGAVDAAIKGTESYIRHMELTHQQGGIAVKNRKTGREIRAPCAVEMWITGYGKRHSQPKFSLGYCIITHKVLRCLHTHKMLR